MSTPFQLIPVRPGIFRLTAPDLDPRLCPGGEIEVNAPGERRGPDPATAAELHPFQRASVEAFVAGQRETRLLLERAMAASRADAWDDEDATGEADVWAEARGEYLHLPLRETLTVEGLLRQWGWVGEIRGVAPEEMEAAREAVAKADTAETRTRFVVGVRVDWDEEHGPYHGVFRDGELVAFGPEET